MAAYVLGVIIMGAIVAAASSGGGAYLYNPNKPMLAYAGNKGFITDASSGLYNSVKCFKLVDAEGNLISEHLIDIDKLMASKSLVNVSDVQVSSKVDKRILRKLVQEIAKTNNLNSVPRAIKTDISYLAGKENTLRVDTVSIPEVKSSDNRISELTVMSERGIFKVSTALNEKSDRQEEGQLSVTVSQLYQEK